MGVHAAVAVGATILLYLVFHGAVVSPIVDRRRDTIPGVALKRVAGAVILGGGAAAVAALFLPFSAAALGVTATIPHTTWLWVAGASVAIVAGCLASSHKAGNFDVYPEMRVARWGPAAVAANASSCALYMFAYEFLFRGFLLFACLAAMNAVLAVAINVALYALAHVNKGPREALGSLPLGVVLCLATIETGAIWAAFLIHLIMSQMNDYLAVRANPAMRFGLRTAAP